MKILVTGVAGRVGRAACEYLGRDHELVGLDQQTSRWTNVVADVGDRGVLQSILPGVDAVVHIAALHAPHVGVLPDSEFQRVNVDATRTLAMLAVENRVRQFIFISTTALYGYASTQSGKTAWIDEAVTPRPKTVYHRSKVAAEDFLGELSAATDLDVTMLRMSRCFPELASLMALYRIHRGVDARDVAQAISLSLQSDGPSLRKFVISGTTPFEKSDLEGLCRDTPGVLARRAPELVEIFHQRQWILPASIDRVYSPRLAIQQLGFKPRYGFREVIKCLDEGSPEVLGHD